ncbi:hypothetical protein LGM65_09910 [Burkholderia anthina]|uniref:hypothetical protein n=1 Tax=Burkholderia anthina TaxID=179879 RepID=UPI001CF3F021|nr:hypothetical protein [Burkholderia anthina]
MPIHPGRCVPVGPVLPAGIPRWLRLGIVWALLAASASHFVVEKPFLRLRDRFAAREARRVNDDARRIATVSEAIGPKAVE